MMDPLHALGMPPLLCSILLHGMGKQTEMLLKQMGTMMLCYSCIYRNSW